MSKGSTRRNFMKGTAAWGGAGTLAGAPRYSSSVYARLGVRPLINGEGTKKTAWLMKAKIRRRRLLA